MLISPKASASTKKGLVRQQSRQVMRPRCHQAQASSTAGNITVEVLLSSASTKARSERPYLREVRGPKSEVRRSESNCTYHRRLKRKKGSDNVFFSSEIHATEATQTGWTAKIIAASQGAGTLNWASTRHNNSALIAWS